MVSLRTLVVGLLALLACASGCASWETPAAATTTLPKPRMSADSVVLEIAFARVPADAAEAAEEVWNAVDEQQLAAEQRRQLAANGFRLGVVGTQLPELIRQSLDTNSNRIEEAANSGLAVGETFQRQRRLPVRSGQPVKIVTMPAARDRLVVLLNDQGYIRVREFTQAQGVFVLHAFPLGDGRVRLQLTPTIEHGMFRNRFVGGDQAFRLQAERETTAFDDLSIDVTLAPGHTMILTHTAEAKGLGDQFFAATTPESDGSLMLIRLAQTQFDDLFSAQRDPSSSGLTGP